MSLENKTNSAISELHMNGEGIDKFVVKIDGRNIVKISYPLLFKRGMFNFLRPAIDTAKYRIYHLDKPLQPGDRVIARIEADNWRKGYTNSMSGTEILNNGTFIFTDN